MLRRFFMLGWIVLVLSVPMVAPSSAREIAGPGIIAYASIAMFSSEDAAQAHCRSDVVVWLNTKTGIWHEKGMRWYGRTKQGAYVCRKEAVAAGYRDTENGQ